MSPSPTLTSEEIIRYFESKRIDVISIIFCVHLEFIHTVENLEKEVSLIFQKWLRYFCFQPIKWWDLWVNKQNQEILKWFNYRKIRVSTSAKNLRDNLIYIFESRRPCRVSLNKVILFLDFTLWQISSNKSKDTNCDRLKGLRYCIGMKWVYARPAWSLDPYLVYRKEMISPIPKPFSS